MARRQIPRPSGCSGPGKASPARRAIQRLGEDSSESIDLTTDVTGTLPVANGGTGQATATAAFNSLDPATTKGDLITHDGTDSVRKAVGTNEHVFIADSAQTTGNKWGQLNLAGAGVTGTLAVANGGTGQTSTTNSFNSLSPLTTKGDVLTHTGSSNVRQGVGSDGQVLTADSAQTNGIKWSTPSGGTNALLDGTNHTDTVAQTVSRGSIIYGDSTPKWNEMTVGTSGQVPYWDGTDLQKGNLSNLAGTVPTGSMPFGGAGSYFSQVGTSPWEIWYIAGTNGECVVGTTFAPARDILYAVPMEIGVAMTLDRLGWRHTSNGSTNLRARIGLYTSTSTSNMYPDALVSGTDTEFTGLNAGAPANKTATVSVSLTANRVYWFAINWGNDTIGMGQQIGLTTGAGAVTPYGLSRILGVSNTFTSTCMNIPLISVANTYSTTALPSTFPASATLTGSGPQMPALFWRRSA